MTKFTKRQISDWEIYEKVRQGGRFNMFDPNARRLTGLSRERYMFALENYSELKEAAEKETA